MIARRALLYVPGHEKNKIEKAAGLIVNSSSRLSALAICTELGFDGKQIVYPDQISPLQESFTPSDEEIKKAQKIINAYKSYEESHQVVFVINGKMIEPPTVASAKKIIELARVVGKV